MKIAAEAGLAPVTLAVAWTLAHDFVGSTIIGATSVAQLEDSLKAADVKLARRDPRRLRRGDAGDPVPDGLKRSSLAGASTL